MDKATEEVHRATEQEFQHWHKLLSQREAAMHMQIATLSDRKKDSMLHGPRAITDVESIAVTETFLSFLLSKSSSYKLVAYMFKVFCLEPICA